MKLTPAAATSTCTSPSPGSARSWSRTCRTVPSPGSETKTLVARFMLATLRPMALPLPGGRPSGTDAHQEGHLVLEGREQGLRVRDDGLVGHDPDAHGVVVGDDAEPHRVPPRPGDPAEHPGDGHSREVADVLGAGDVRRDSDRLVGEEVHDAALHGG